METLITMKELKHLLPFALLLVFFMFACEKNKEMPQIITTTIPTDTIDSSVCFKCRRIEYVGGVVGIWTWENRTVCDSLVGDSMESAVLEDSTFWQCFLPLE